METEINTPSKISKNIKPFKLNSCAFISHELYPIVSLAYNPTHNLLAVARETINSIEIYRYPSFALLFTYSLNASDLISKVLFNKTENIFIICQNGMLYEYSLHCQIPLQSMLIPGGAINDISFNARTSEYLLASEDGTVKIYEFNVESSKIGFSKAARKFPSRVLACIWDDSDFISFFGSYQNGFIRKFDKLLNVTMVINLAVNEKKTVFAWRLLCASKNLICGCSNGTIGIFETKFGTLIKNIKTHEADILALVSNTQQNVIYATGSDSRIFAIENLSEIETNNWVVTSQERGQSHDIYALVLINDELLISAGLTTDLCLYKLQGNRFLERMIVKSGKKKEEIEKKSTLKLRHITSLQHRNLIQVSESSKNLILYQKAFGLELWEMDPETNNFRFVIEIKNKEKVIVSSCLSLCGTFLAYSTIYSITIYHIRGETSMEKLMEIEDFAASALKFSVDSNILYFVSTKGDYYQYDIQSKSSNFISSLVQNEEKKMTIDESKSENSEIFEHIEVCLEDGLVAFGSKLKNSIVIYKEKEFYYEIPIIMSSGYSCFKFSLHSDKLIVVYENNKFAIFDLKGKCLDKWSFKNINKFPSDIVNTHNRIIGIVFHPDQKDKFILYSNFFYIVINTKDKIPKKARKIKCDEISKLKNPCNFDIISRKFPILHMSNYNGNEFILFQNSWIQMLKNMPGAINTKKFGN